MKRGNISLKYKFNIIVGNFNNPVSIVGNYIEDQQGNRRLEQHSKPPRLNIYIYIYALSPKKNSENLKKD